MDGRKEARDAPSSTDERDETLAREAAAEYKEKLQRQIRGLKNLIRQAERNLDIAKFGAVTNSHEFSQEIADRRRVGNAPNLFVRFGNELYRYAGMYCVKFSKTEYVFDFASLDKDEKPETFSVQIRNDNGKPLVKKWVLPMSTDMKKILPRAPMSDIATVVPFLRNCKRHVDCYTRRKNEYRELGKRISDTRDVKLDSNVGFTLISLQLCRVYDKVKDSFLDLTIYLSYKSDETRPYATSYDWNLDKNPLPSETNAINAYTKYLKNHSLAEGFRRTIETTHPIYSWSPENRVDALADALELDYTSESSEYEPVVVRAKKKRGNIESANENASRKILRVSRPSRSGPTRDDENSVKNTQRRLRPTTLNVRRRDRAESRTASSRKLGGAPNGKPVVRRKKVSGSIPIFFIEKKNTNRAVKNDARPAGLPSKKRRSVSRRNVATTSTPLQRTAKNRVKFAPVNVAQLSPILSAD